MPKRLSEKQKNEILKSFSDGYSLDQLSEKFQVTKLTISNNLKKKLGDEEYKRIIKNKKLTMASSSKVEDETLDKNTKYKNNQSIEDNYSNKHLNDKFFFDSQFVEITPLSEDRKY